LQLPVDQIVNVPWLFIESFKYMKNNNSGIYHDLFSLSNPTPPEAKPGTLFRQPQLDRETRSQTGRPAFKEYPTRLPGFS
jgi:hypothetical protein